VSAGDADRAGRVFADLQQRYGKTAYAQQGALAAAQVQFKRGQADAARASLQWVVDNATEAELATVARLRLAGLQSEAGQHDAALATLAAAAPGFEGLVADRRGDVLAAQGKTDEARAAYQAAYAALGPSIDYRRVVEAKLTALGAPPAAAAASAPGAAS
jgi:predicted negative regulator of RcsB-dependent stress response